MCSNKSKPTNNWERQASDEKKKQTWNWFVQYFCTSLHKNISALLFVVSFISLLDILFCFGYLFHLPFQRTIYSRNILFSIQFENNSTYWGTKKRILSMYMYVFLALCTLWDDIFFPRRLKLKRRNSKLRYVCSWKAKRREKAKKNRIEISAKCFRTWIF